MFTVLNLFATRINYYCSLSVGTGVVRTDDPQPPATSLKPVVSLLPHATPQQIETEGLGDILQKLLPNKPKELPTNLRPYPMDKSPHGYCLIINNMNFRNKPSRTGSDVDERSLRKLFPTLGYHLYEDQAHTDLTASQMRLLLQRVADSDHSTYDSFICYLASHGTTGMLYGSDDRLIPIDEIQAIFSDCKSLVGKPKIFFIQACRGLDLPEGRVVQDDGDEDYTVLPRDSDIFFGYATTPDTKACRFTDIGSWYVIELCKQLQSYHKYVDLQTMVTAVHYEVATNKEYVYNYTDHRTGKQKSYKQCPQLASTLTRPVYFKLDAGQ